MSKPPGRSMEDRMAMKESKYPRLGSTTRMLSLSRHSVSRSFRNKGMRAKNARGAVTSDSFAVLTISRPVASSDGSSSNEASACDRAALFVTSRS